KTTGSGATVTSAGMVTITVSPINLPDQNAIGYVGQSLALPGLAQGPSRLALYSNSVNGPFSASLAPTFAGRRVSGTSYTPAAGYSGSDIFYAEIRDVASGLIISNVAKVTASISQVVNGDFEQYVNLNPWTVNNAVLITGTPPAVHGGTHAVSLT